VIYVSCNPGTLARDLAHFETKGYKVDIIQPVDMFPQTVHVETVVRMQKTK
jgi:23S rRNA (uracil1939-C5)-methyltransferase